MENVPTQNPIFSLRGAPLLLRAVLGLALLLHSSRLASAENLTQLDASLPNYDTVPLAKTELSSVGSDSMGGLMEVWVEQYKTLQPNVEIKVVSQGSATAAAALIEGSADIGPMAREMKEAELEEFKSRYGFEPTQIRTALAGVAIYVNAENPLKGISLEQLDSIFSVQKNRGLGKALSTWADLDVSGNLAAAPIMAVGSSGHATTRAYFKQQVMLQGDFQPQVSDTASLQGLFDTVLANKGAIAFGEIHTAPPGIRILPVSRRIGEPAVLPSLATLTAEEYPLGRYLNFYLVREPGQTVEAATKDFLRFVLSRQGQELVTRRGLIPLPSNVATQELEKIS